MNTLTTKDVAKVAFKPRHAYDFFGIDWPTSGHPDSGDTPIASFGLGLLRTAARSQAYGLHDMGDLGLLRTSARSQKYGLHDMGLGFLGDDVLGIPVWMLAAGAAAIFVPPKLMKKK